MIHLPKLALPHGSLAHPRAFPIWFPAALLALAFGAALLAAQLALGTTPSIGEGRPSLSPLEAYVMTFVNTYSTDRDPLVSLPGGVQAKASNVYGVVYNGERYFYQLTRDSSFDPLRLRSISDYEVVSVVDAGSPSEVLIYRAR